MFGYSALVAEIALVWYSMDDSSVIATRGQAAQWAEELNMPHIQASSATPGNFRKSCQETEVTYPGPRGGQRIAKAIEVARRPELLTFEVRRGQIRLAQIKLFTERRTVNGQVSGSSRVITKINRQADAHDVAGASLWIQSFTTAYEQECQIVPSKVIRRIAVQTLLETATPIVNRKWLYYAYVDQLAPANRLRTFLARVCDDADVTILPIERGAELTTFITSADADLFERISDFNERLRTYIGGRFLKQGSERYGGILDIYRTLVARVAEHEERLSAQLTTSHSALQQTKYWMQVADPTGYLLRVSSQ